MEPNSTSPDALDALRIQAAAVAAQQAALTEEELRLQQRRGALEKQEAQLAAHLDDRRRRLVELQNDIKAQRASLKQERAGLLDELREEKENVVRERQRLEELRERQKQRWREHWRQHETALKQREQELHTAREQVQTEAEALERERTTFELGRLRLNGEQELNRRKLKEEWHELGLAQQHWDEALDLEHADRRRLDDALAARETAVAQAERELAEQKYHWEQELKGRRQELDGLEKRILPLRAQLPRTEVIVAPAPAGPRPVPEQDVPPALHRLAGDVVDQRWRLLEQWQRLLEVHNLWDKEKADIARALEATALQFIEREQRLSTQERDLEDRRDATYQQQQELGEQRRRLEGWHSQLTVQESSWQSERAALLTDIQAREEGIAGLTQQLDMVRQRRDRRRRQEIEELREIRGRCEEMRHQYVALWQDTETRQTALLQREREWSVQRLALERYRVECLSRSSNPAAAEKRVEKLTQRLTARFAAAERETATQREVLVAEAARLDDQAEQLRQFQQELDCRSQDLAERETSEVTHRLERIAAEQQPTRELRQLQLRRDQDERQLSALRDEVERVARLLLDESGDAMLTRAA